MGKKVDIEAMIAASDQKNSMTGRAPLAPGFEEDVPTKPEPTEMSQVIVTVPPMTEGRDFTREEADTDNAAFDAMLRTKTLLPVVKSDEPLAPVDAEGIASGVLVPHVFETPKETAPEVAPESMTEVQILAAQVLTLTKRLEDFGALPREVSNKPHVPVVTLTPLGNKRTDW